MRSEIGAIALRAVSGGRNETDRPGCQIFDKDVGASIGVVGTRLDARLINISEAPSGENSMLPMAEPPFACVPSAAVCTRVIAPFVKSFTKMSALPLVSPGTRFDAKLSKAIHF